MCSLLLGLHLVVKRTLKQVPEESHLMKICKTNNGRKAINLVSCWKELDKWGILRPFDTRSKVGSAMGTRKLQYKVGDVSKETLTKQGQHECASQRKDR